MLHTGVRRLRCLPEIERCLLLVRQSSVVAQTHEDVIRIRPYEEMPGPKATPIIGNIWRFIPGIGEYGTMDFNRILLDMYNRYGNIAKISNIIGRRDVVFVFDPQDMQTLYRNEGQWPVRRPVLSIPYYRGVLRKDFFRGIQGTAFTDGKEWHDFRTKVNQTMMQPRKAKLYVGTIDEVAKDFLGRIRDLRDENDQLPSDFMKQLNLWALESIGIVALDTRLGCLSPNLKTDSEPKKMINAVNVVFRTFYDLEFKPNFIPFTWKKSWRELVKANDIFNEVAMKYIQSAMERVRGKSWESESELSVLESLLLKNENPMIACVMALDMLMAGIDTTSNATATTFHYLARNQEKQEVLFQEVKQVLPSKNEPITAAHLEKLKYLKACIKEAMRLSATISVNARRTNKDLVLSNYIVPKDTDVLMGYKVLNVQEEHFKDAGRFLPERWLKGESQQKIHPFAFLPFGFGPRSCIGRRFAELEMETLIANVIRNFRMEYDQELRVTPAMTNLVSSPLSFKLEERS